VPPRRENWAPSAPSKRPKKWAADSEVNVDSGLDAHRQENALFRILLAVDCRPLFWKRRVWAKEAAEVPPRREK